ncbi:MAG: hypothetical protein DMG54_33730 [Acidobacteria bacterium]|nr:MAG: hypothetical protein DMG54_33730 [Acidobacteriota bacterium]PYU67813.1 MAG: hypothetical protein DMG52_33140 [Acidobacteriota bacterium]
MMDAASKATGFKINKWGVSGLAAWLLSYLAAGICMKVFKEDRSACLVPYIVLHLSAVTCSIVAAVRGSKWWLLMSLITAGLAIQAFLALLVE